MAQLALGADGAKSRRQCRARRANGTPSQKYTSRFHRRLPDAGQHEAPWGHLHFTLPVLVIAAPVDSWRRRVRRSWAKIARSVRRQFAKLDAAPRATVEMRGNLSVTLPRLNRFVYAVCAVCWLLRRGLLDRVGAGSRRLFRARFRILRAGVAIDSASNRASRCCPSSIPSRPRRWAWPRRSSPNERDRAATCSGTTKSCTPCDCDKLGLLERYQPPLAAEYPGHGSLARGAPGTGLPRGPAC